MYDSWRLWTGRLWTEFWNSITRFLGERVSICLGSIIQGRRLPIRHQGTFIFPRGGSVTTVGGTVVAIPPGGAVIDIRANDGRALTVIGKTHQEAFGALVETLDAAGAFHEEQEEPLRLN